MSERKGQGLQVEPAGECGCGTFGDGVYFFFANEIYKVVASCPVAFTLISAHLELVEG